MALLVCTDCGHTSDEHHDGGCMDTVDWNEAGGYMELCPCPRTLKSLYDEAVANGRVPGR